MHATIELTDLVLPVDLGTYGADDVVPDAHYLDLILTLSASLVFIEADEMSRIFDYDPLIRDIERIARDGHYETQEWLMTRIVKACTAYDAIEAVELMVYKGPVLAGTGKLGVRLRVDAREFATLRAQQK